MDNPFLKNKNLFLPCVYVWPPGNIKAKFNNRVSKGTFLEYDQHTTQNVIYYDSDTHNIKLDSHTQFYEGVNNFPMSYTPLNAQHIHIVDNGQPLPEEQKFVPASQFEFSISPFKYFIHVLLEYTPSYPYPNFWFPFQYYYLLKISFSNTIKPIHPASKIFSNPRSTNNNLRGAILNSIHLPVPSPLMMPWKTLAYYTSRGCCNSHSPLHRKINYRSKRLGKQPMSMTSSPLILDGIKTLIWTKLDPLQQPQIHNNANQIFWARYKM